MLNPADASKSPLSSRVALLTALFLAGLFGLVATLVLPVTNFKKSSARVAALPVRTEPEPVSIAGSPSATTCPAPSATELVKFCSDNVNETRSFVIFQRGTCVVIDEPCQNPLAEARRRLAACTTDADVRFISEPTAEGDLIVTFKEPVFQRFSKDELAKHESWLVHATPTLLSPAESVAAGKGWSPPTNARFGLLARRRLLEDAANPVPVRIIRAKTRATGGQ
ncbi:MAG: hypothetical protein ACRDBP_14265 [Luteolibacter sp.]